MAYTMLSLCVPLSEASSVLALAERAATCIGVTYLIQIIKTGAGEMAQQSIALATLTEDPGLVPITYMVTYSHP